MEVHAWNKDIAVVCKGLEAEYLVPCLCLIRLEGE